MRVVERLLEPPLGLSQPLGSVVNEQQEPSQRLLQEHFLGHVMGTMAEQTRIVMVFLLSMQRVVPHIIAM